MVFLLDTNAVSDLMGANPAVDACLAAVAPDDRVVVCTIVRGEILYGIERLAEGKRKDDFKSKAARIFSSLPCEGLTQSIGDIYARVKASCMAGGCRWTTTTSGSLPPPLNQARFWSRATAIFGTWKG